MKRLIIGLVPAVLLACGSNVKSHGDAEDTVDVTDADTGEVDVEEEEAPPEPVLVVEADTPESPQTGTVTIAYRLIDERVPATSGDVTVEFSADGGPWSPATAAGGEGTSGLASAAAPGASHSFSWDTAADLGLGVTSVVVRITPYDAGTDRVGTAGSTDPFDVVYAELTAAAASRVLDPEMPGSPVMTLGYRVDPSGADFTMTVIVRTGAGAEVRRIVDGASQPGGTDLTATWDGTDDSGTVVDTGSYEVLYEAAYGTLPAWTATETVYIARLGVAGVQFLDNGTAGDHHQLMYHIRNTAKYSYYAISTTRPQWALGRQQGELVDLDTDDGLARPLPAPWTDLDSPPQDTTDPAGVEDDTLNLPACYTRASVPRIRVTLGTGAVSNSSHSPIGVGYPIDMPIRILVAGATPATAGANESITPGSSVEFVADTALPDEINKHTLSWIFTFEYRDGTTWVPVPGSITTDHTVYTIYGPPTLSASTMPTPPYLPWVRLVDMVCSWVGGPATASDMCGTVIDRVNTFFGLQYDIISGACHYASGNVDAHIMEMSDFLEDYDAGTFTTVNCSDCACISTTFANMVGVDHQYEILGMTDRIPLNYQIPIGRWWMVPFSGSFRYHAVSTFDLGTTISDATCTLDDDTDPSSPPHTPILPVNMPYLTYKQKLSWDPTSWDMLLRNRAGIH